MKKAFSLIMAIFFVVLLATLGIMALGFSTQTAKQSMDIYLREQAELLARSATEFAVMAMQDHDYAANNCLQTVRVNYPEFVAVVEIYYLDASMEFRGTTTKHCDEDRILTGVSSALSGGTTPIYDNIAMLDVTVTSNAGTEPIRYFRRTIQRP
ncbi:hypothetical protein [Campylobacter geochelonis]|uniref:hypothetical protein n=1 Tax=Campylobacter geochelonis TaxID=1780362 RepID=UPI000770B101|nr:hypothetical protein [Campylobacter geochelonis]CZE47619.1 periplasmic protein [Campylobacter geochelonis]CZE50177.1 periplasmic protein [Campylobacter geochelonis]